MTREDLREYWRERHSHYQAVPLYDFVELHKALYSLGYSINKEDLYAAMKGTGWIKLRLIRDRLLELKRSIPKSSPREIKAIRDIIKWPLLVPRNADLPNFEKGNTV